MNDVERLLRLLDPGADDRGYWERFHRRVMARARPTLSARRAGPEPDFFSVVEAWSRLLIPAAVAAAVVAGLWLGSGGGAAPTPTVTVEEYLPEAAGGIPAVLTSGNAPDAAAVLATAERY